MTTSFGYVEASNTDNTCRARRYFESLHFNKDPDIKKKSKVVYFHDYFLVSIITITTP